MNVPPETRWISVEGSDDELTWKPLDEQIYVPGKDRGYTLRRPAPYMYYRVNFNLTRPPVRLYWRMFLTWIAGRFGLL